MPTGPETITVFKVLKRDGDYVKFDDNQQHKWNCSNGDISPHIKEGVTIDVWWEPYEGELPDGKKYTSKYIQKAKPSDGPAQELKQPFSGGSGSGGGKSSSKGDFRSKEEIRAAAALEYACSLITPTNTDDTVRLSRKMAMETAEVFIEWMKDKGAAAGTEEKPAWGADQSAPSAPATPAAGGGWGDATEDDDIPF